MNPYVSTKQWHKKAYVKLERLLDNQCVNKRDIVPESISLSSENVWLTVDRKGRVRIDCPPDK